MCRKYESQSQSERENETFTFLEYIRFSCFFSKTSGSEEGEEEKLGISYFREKSLSQADGSLTSL